MNKFKDKVAIVTGGASGIGHMLCEELSSREAFAIVADINIEGAEQVASNINKAGKKASTARVDVSKAEDIQLLIDEAFSKHGRLDYMFNNAGIAITGEFRDVNIEHWRRIMDVNLWSVIYGTTAAYSLMVKQGFGHIINISSLAGILGSPIGTSYAATKSAVIGLSTSLRAEAADLGIKVSVVCPGFVKTGIYDASVIIKANRKDLISKIPLKMMDAKEAARCILRGVERNQSVIVFPFHARLLWWLYRISPSLILPLVKKAVRDFRTLRKE